MVQPNVNLGDVNRHLQEVNREIPVNQRLQEVNERPPPEDRVKAPRRPLDNPRQDTVQDSYEQAIEMARSRVSEHEVRRMEAEMGQFLDSFYSARRSYTQSARALDAGVGHESGLGGVVVSVGVFILDWVAFTFTFFALLDSVFSAKGGYHRPMAEIVVYAAPVAFVTAFAVRLGAKEAQKSPSWLFAYILAWVCFAIADISYLMREGIANVGLAMTGLLVVMCVITLGHARSSATGAGRKAALQKYSDDYKNYYIKQSQLRNALDQICDRPEKGLARILHGEWYEFIDEDDSQQD